MLFRAPGHRQARRCAARRRSSQAWPRDLPLTVEFRDPSWAADEVVAALRDAGAVLCATEDEDDEEPPTLRRTGPFLYLRLRRHDYTADQLDAWRDRLEPFLAAGDDAFVFFRHDETGAGRSSRSELWPRSGQLD